LQNLTKNRPLRVAPWGRMDMMKLTYAFRKVVNAPKIMK